MKGITVKELSLNDFSKYGTFAGMINPDGCKIGEEPIEFYRDLVTMSFERPTVAFSVTRILKRPLIIDSIEFHSSSEEGMLPLDGDVLLSVAPATANGDIPDDRVEVFHVPKGMMVMVRPGVWHSAPFTYNADCANVVIVLPERTYANDCSIVRLSGEKLLKINE